MRPRTHREETCACESALPAWCNSSCHLIIHSLTFVVPKLARAFTIRCILSIS